MDLSVYCVHYVHRKQPAEAAIVAVSPGVAMAFTRRILQRGTRVTSCEEYSNGKEILAKMPPLPDNFPYLLTTGGIVYRNPQWIYGCPSSWGGA